MRSEKEIRELRDFFKGVIEAEEEYTTPEEREELSYRNAFTHDVELLSWVLGEASEEMNECIELLMDKA